VVKKLVSVLALIIFIGALLAVVAPQSARANPGWWNPSWQYRMKLTFDNTASNEDLIDFPVLVNLNSTHADFWAHVSSSITTTDTRDLRFVDADDSTELYFEVEMIDYATNEAVIWVKIPQIDAGSSSDHIYVYYGNPTATQSVYHSAGDVWDNDFEMVQHMKDETTSIVKDSTSNNHDGTKKSANGPAEIDGTIAKGQDFSSDHVSCGELGIGNSYTAECWIKADTLVGSGDQNTYGFTVMASSVLGQGYPLWLTVRGTEVRLWAYEGSSTS